MNLNLKFRYPAFNVFTNCIWTGCILEAVLRYLKMVRGRDNGAFRSEECLTNYHIPLHVGHMYNKLELFDFTKIPTF